MGSEDGCMDGKSGLSERCVMKRYTVRTNKKKPSRIHIALVKKMRQREIEGLTRNGLSRFVIDIIKQRKQQRFQKNLVMIILTLLFVLSLSFKFFHTRTNRCEATSFEPTLTEDQKDLIEMIDRICGDRILLVLNMFPAARSGWGFLAMNIFVRLSNEGRFCPVLTDKPEGEAFLTEYNLKSQFLTHYYNQEVLSEKMRHYHQSVEFLNCPVFHAIPGTFDASPGFLGVFNFGYITVEQPSIRDDEMERSVTYDFIVSPSRWNTDILRNHGIENVGTVCEGVVGELWGSCEGAKRPSIRDLFFHSLHSLTHSHFFENIFEFSGTSRYRD